MARRAAICARRRRRGQLLQLVLERQLCLHRVPAARILLFGGLPAVDLHAEAFEAERPRTLEHRIVRILEAVARFTFTTAGT